MPEQEPVDQAALARIGKPTPVYVSSIELSNFRCFRETQQVSFTDESGRPSRWTLILGDNGVGKTTLLECIAATFPVTRGSRDKGSSKKPHLSSFPTRTHFFQDGLRADFKISTHLHIGSFARKGQSLSTDTEVRTGSFSSNYKATRTKA